MNVQLAVIIFLAGMFLAAFVDVSSTGEKFSRQTSAMRERNMVGYWIGWCAWMAICFLVMFVTAPVAMAYSFVAMAGAVAYFILSFTLQRLSRKA